MESFVESLLLLIVGMGGVFSALLLLAGMIWLFRAADEQLNRRRIRKYAKTVETAPGVEEINDEIVAVLSAAAVAALRKPIRIRRVRFLTAGGEGAWAVTGRLNVMASHQISRRKS
jgi:sodium pump decarboxylase gamma subunit